MDSQKSDIAVLSCIWQRPERLEYTLRQLSRQTFRSYTVFLINNNPDLYQFAEDKVFDFRIDTEQKVWLIQNEENKGPYARLEWMHRLKDKFDWFVTLDDDANFPDNFLATWWVQRDAQAVQGWNGFKFNPGGSYWDRKEVLPGENAHYLWGSNLFVPKAAIGDGLLDLDPKYRLFADDLWLCYYANAHKGMALQKAKFAPGVFIEVDGKDTYRHFHAEKSWLLEELRAKGWEV
jgi:hypothetical protein